MEISEELCPEDMIVHEMTTPTIIMGEAARGAGAGEGSGELGRRLLLAARHGDTPLVLDLMAKGAPFTTDWLGTSALHAAARGAHADTCGVLLRAGVSRDCRTKVERTPLHLAAAAGHAAVAALLLAHGAAVDCRDMLRMTPLHWAAERGHARLAELLLRHGADPRARSKFRKTPRDLAARRRRADLTRLLDEAASPAAPCPAPAPAPAPPASPPAPPAPAPASAASLAAAAMLRRHGIALLPRDEGSTVLSALQSGRSVVLSDAGKLLLKESGEAPARVSATPSKGVVLTATPVKSPPRQGVKIFTLNNKLLAMPKENKVPIKKVIDPHDSKQIQYIKLPSDARTTPSRSIPVKAKTKLASPSRAPPAPPAPLARPTVKLVMQRPAQKLNSAESGAEAAPAEARNVLFVPEEFLTNSSSKYLRAQLLTAHKTIAELTAQLSSYKTRLAKYEKL